MGKESQKAKGGVWGQVTSASLAQGHSSVVIVLLGGDLYIEL